MTLNFFYFLATALIINLTPGPAMLFIMNESIINGRRSAIKAALGIELGVLFYVAATAFGLSFFFQTFPIIYTCLEILGILYLMILALKSWPRKKVAHTHHTHHIRTQPKHVFLKAMLITLLNPKIGLFFFSLLPQFVPQHATHVWPYLFGYGMLFNLSGLCVNISMAILAQHYSSRFSHSSPYLSYIPPLLFLVIALFAGYQVLDK
ncbi:LysE family translocator [Acinetobacter nectaris]|uniref:LysE family translocator n=1 Tax=Acinetobacter nectaris TaxID=1219382 RepID=UPI001F47BDB1|nr:LysE family translocator [Acinetobacter nectaris]MCF9047090.1 LysE family translocator [Acinetobacter nectaris]